MTVVWYVLTPAGRAGPYYLQSAARDAARPFGWKVVREKRDETKEVSEHEAPR